MDDDVEVFAPHWSHADSFASQPVGETSITDGIDIPVPHCDDLSDEDALKCGTKKCTKPFINPFTKIPNFGTSNS